MREGRLFEIDSPKVVFYLEKLEVAPHAARLTLEKMPHSSHSDYYIQSGGQFYHLIERELSIPPANSHLSLKFHRVALKGAVASFEGNYFSSTPADPFKPPSPFTLEIPRNEAQGLGFIDSHGLLKRRAPLYFGRGSAPMQTLTPHSQEAGGAGSGIMNLPGFPNGKKGVFFAPHDKTQGPPVGELSPKQLKEKFEGDLKELQVVQFFENRNSTAWKLINDSMGALRNRISGSRGFDEGIFGQMLHPHEGLDLVLEYARLKSAPSLAKDPNFEPFNLQEELRILINQQEAKSPKIYLEKLNYEITQLKEKIADLNEQMRDVEDHHTYGTNGITDLFIDDHIREIHYDISKCNKELELLNGTKKAFVGNPKKAWAEAIENRIQLLHRVLEYQNDPEINGNGELDAVVEAQDQLLNQKKDFSYQMPPEMRAKVALAVRWASQVEDFIVNHRKAGHRPFNLLEIWNAKKAKYQNQKKPENLAPDAEMIGKSSLANSIVGTKGAGHDTSGARTQGAGGAGLGPVPTGIPGIDKGVKKAPHDKTQGAQTAYPATSIDNRPLDVSLISAEKGFSHDRPESKWRNWEVSNAYESRVFLLSPKHLSGQRYRMFFKGSDPIPFWIGQRVDIVWEGQAESGEAQKKIFQECQRDFVSLEKGLELEQISFQLTPSGLLLGRALEVRADMYRKQSSVQSPLPPTQVNLDLPSSTGLIEFTIRRKPTAQDFVSFALEYARMKSALPVTKLYEDLKRQKK
jgi:hypothetical protein